MRDAWRSSEVRRFTAALAVVVSIVAGVLVVPLSADDASAASAKVTICHRTHSTTNPYRKITVSQNAITRNGGHKGHQVTNGNPPVYDATFTYASNNKSWGDVIPGATDGGSTYNGSTSIARNWTVAGRTLFFSAACAGMTAKQFYETEIAAGVPEADVLADLNGQGANEDLALLAALGGSFTSGNVTQWSTAVSVTTTAPSAVGSTTATLNGHPDGGDDVDGDGLRLRTSPTLATGTTSIAATPAPVTGSNKTVAANLTGLTSGVTYYFRATGTTNANTDIEGVLLGDVLTFTTPGVAAQTITFDQPVDLVLGGGTQTLTNATASPSGLAVTFTSDTPSICSVAGEIVTALDVGTCSITASQPGNATFAVTADAGHEDLRRHRRRPDLDDRRRFVRLGRLPDHGDTADDHLDAVGRRRDDDLQLDDDRGLHDRSRLR